MISLQLLLFGSCFLLFFSLSSSEIFSLPELYKDNKLEILGRFSEVKTIFPKNNESSWLGSWPGVGYRFRFGPELSSDSLNLGTSLRGNSQEMNSQTQIILHFKPCRLYNKASNRLETTSRCSYDIGLFLNCEETPIERYTITKNVHMITFVLPYQYKLEALNELRIVKLISSNFFNFLELEAIEVKTEGLAIFSIEQASLLSKAHPDLLACSFPYKKHGLFIGDSISAGGFLSKKSSLSQCYSFMTANQLGSTADIIAINGASVMRNINMPSMWENVVPALSKRDFPGNLYPSPLDFLHSGSFSSLSDKVNQAPYQAFLPDYIVMALGTNDYYSLSNAESAERFINMYTEFSREVFRKYSPSPSELSTYSEESSKYGLKYKQSEPKVPVVFTCSPMEVYGVDCPPIRKVVENLSKMPEMAHLDIRVLDYDRSLIDLEGIMAHPSARDSITLSTQLVSLIKEIKSGSKSHLRSV